MRIILPRICLILIPCVKFPSAGFSVCGKITYLCKNKNQPGAWVVLALGVKYQVMSDLQLVKRFALSYGADHVYVFKQESGRTFYRICTKALLGKKTGLPVLVEVVRNRVVKLSAEQVMGLIIQSHDRT